MGNNNLLVAQTGEVASGIYPCHAKNLCNILLCQINTSILPAGRILEKEIQKVAQLDKGAVVLLMGALVQ